MTAQTKVDCLIQFSGHLYKVGDLVRREEIEDMIVLSETNVDELLEECRAPDKTSEGSMWIVPNLDYDSKVVEEFWATYHQIICESEMCGVESEIEALSVEDTFEPYLSEISKLLQADLNRRLEIPRSMRLAPLNEPIQDSTIITAWSYWSGFSGGYPGEEEWESEYDLIGQVDLTKLSYHELQVKA